MGLRVSDLKQGNVYKFDNGDGIWYECLIEIVRASEIKVKIVGSWDTDYLNITKCFSRTSNFFRDREISLVSEEYTQAVGKRGYSHPDKDLRTKYIKDSDRKILNELFINLAIDTNDKRWFNNLTKGVEENAN